MPAKTPVLSSSHVLSLIEEKFSIAWIVFPSDGSDWTGSRSLDYFLGYDASTDSLRARFLKAVHADDRTDLLLDLSFLTKRTLPCRRSVRLQVAGRTERQVQIEFRHVEGPGFDNLNLLLLRDVSQEHYNTEKLAQFERRLEQAMRTWQMKALWWADTNYNMMDYVGRDELIFDRELLGKQYTDIVPKDDQGALMLDLMKTGQAEKPFCLPIRLIGLDGVTRAYQLRGAPYRVEGEIAGWTGYVSPSPLTVMPRSSAVMDGELMNHLSAPLLRAGCAALGWSYGELAARAKVSASTVNRILGTSGPLIQAFRLSSLTTLVEALEAAGVTFHLEAQGSISLRLSPVHN